MEITSTPSPVLGCKQTPARKVGGGSCNDLWSAARNGSIQDVDIALMLFKKSNGNVDARSVLGSTALHIAVWRNHIPIVRRLLVAGANPDAKDVESGWSSLHRALHLGHLAVAGVLIDAGASLVLEDTKGRIPFDLISGPVNSAIANPLNSGLAEVYSWGNGANYQLGIGTAGIQRIPCRLDALQNLDVRNIAAAKFHSAAVTASGDVYTWGFGRGGRLGHPDFDIHSGQVAVIIPRKVISGLVGKRVKGIAVAKHHTVISTDGGEVYTWGSNRDGRLGYPSVDTQATPRKVGTLKARVEAVAAANKHSAVLTENGDVYTWGCNSEGQLGYGTSNSASNCTPRLVDYLKGRPMVAISTAKYHTVVLGAGGEVMTWGYKMVTPRRVIIARDTRKKGPNPPTYHRRLHAIAIAAGMTHSTLVTEDGLIFYWVSADQHLHPQQLPSIAGDQAVSVAAGKYRTAVATITGNVYAWDGEGSKANVPPSPVRVHGAKHITRLSVGETHSLAVASLYAPTYSSNSVSEALAVPKATGEGEESNDEDAEVDEESGSFGAAGPSRTDEGVPSLKDLCQKVVKESIVEPKNALQLLEFADSLDADHLKRYCEDLILRNLDYILTISSSTFGQLPTSLLAELENALDSSSNEPWGQRSLPTPNATLPVVVDSEEEDSDTYGGSRIHNSLVGIEELDYLGEKSPIEGFLPSGDSRGEDALAKQVRAVRKKLQQIEALEFKQLNGYFLDSQQLAKLLSKPALEISLSLIESGVLPPEIAMSKVKSSVLGMEVKTAAGEGENATTAKHGGRARRRKSKGSSGRGQSVDSPPVVKSKEASKYGEFDLQETLQEIPLLKSTEEPSHPSPSALCSSEPEIPQEPSSTSAEFQEISGFTTTGLGASSDSWANAHTPKSSSKKKAKKGGLSMFLSGELEAPPKPLIPSPPPVPKADGPAWGGTHLPKGSASLRDIQTQQSAMVIQSRVGPVSPVEITDSPSAKPFNREKDSTGVSSQEMVMKKVNSLGTVLRNPIFEKAEGSGVKTRTPPATFNSAKTSSVGSSSSGVNLGRSEPATEPAVDEVDGGVLRVPLSEFVRSSAPIAVVPSRRPQSLHPENSPHAWAGRSPGTSAPLLRDIQVQQVKQHIAQHRPIASRGSPQLTSPLGLMTPAPGSSAQSFDHASSSAETPNRWYKPEVANPSPIRNIQKEEEAMKDLRRLYKSVKIVKPDDY